MVELEVFVSLKRAVLAVPGTKFGRREGRTRPPPKLEVPTVPCNVPKPSHLLLRAGGEPGPLRPGLTWRVVGRESIL